MAQLTKEIKLNFIDHPYYNNIKKINEFKNNKKSIGLT
jgi:hypothetical protein